MIQSILGFFHGLVQSERRNWLLVICIALLLLTGSLMLWHSWSDTLLATKLTMQAESIEIPQQPGWINSDVKMEVIRDSGLQEVNALDRKASEQVFQAFAVHTWIAKVKRVQKFPGPKFVVELIYRKPIAMVEVFENNQRGLLPVDAEGILLPPSDFSPNQTRNYLRISAGRSLPAGPVGTPWGDLAVLNGSRIAEVLEGKWKEFGFYRIVALPANGKQKEQVFDIYTKGGSRVIWGNAPGHELQEEVSANEKLARLKSYYQKHGSLDGSRVDLDLRWGDGIEVRPRTATLPEDLFLNSTILK